MNIQHIYTFLITKKARLWRWRSLRPVAVLILTLGLGSCIEPYIADIDNEPELISIEGSLVKGLSRQEIVVSRTTSLGNPVFEPVKGCMVTVLDELNNEFRFDETYNGIYTLEMDQEALVPGRNYKMIVVTPGGDHYESEYETLQGGVPVDSVYYSIEEQLNPENGISADGLQFYVDLQAPDTISRYFRWKITETYEYTSAGPINYYYVDLSFEPVVPDDIWGLYRCWKTEELGDIYLTSTLNLTANEKKQIPLNYVTTLNDRLKIKYSLLVYQYALDEEAYNYFMQNKIATEGSEGLYTRQPQQPVTNIYNVDNEEERVLGYFWTSELSSRRIFVPKLAELDVKDYFYPLEVFNMEDHGAGPFPMAIMVEEGVRITGSPICFDCTRRGGTTQRPSYWE